MHQADEWSGDTVARFSNWVEQFYEDNLDQIFEQANSDLGKEQLLARLARWALQTAAEQFSQKEIAQFLAAVAEERGYDEVQQFCRQIAECQQLWIILNECRLDTLTERRGRDGTSSAAEAVPADTPNLPTRRPYGRAPHAARAQDGLDAAVKTREGPRGMGPNGPSSPRCSRA